jgi:hypothetical protein
MDEDIDFSRVDFVEIYDNEKDPWQMNNLVKDPRAKPVSVRILLECSSHVL